MAAQAKLQLENVEEESSSVTMTAAELKPILEALIYVAEEPIPEATLVALLGKEHQEAIREGLHQLLEQYRAPGCGLEIKEVASGYKIATKAEHHEWVRKYVKHHRPPTKLSLASLETLAVIAYRQPITVPEIQEVRGVNAISVLKTLLDKKLITTSGRKNVIGRPILYRTTKEFLIHFGLKNLDELPSLEEFEDLARSAAGAVAEASDSETSAQIQNEIVQPQTLLESAASEAVALPDPVDASTAASNAPTLPEAEVLDRLSAGLSFIASATPEAEAAAVAPELAESSEESSPGEAPQGPEESDQQTVKRP